MCVCVCVCARARARARVCVRVCVCVCAVFTSYTESRSNRHSQQVNTEHQIDSRQSAGNLDDSGKTKVGDLHADVFADENVPCGEIAVNVVLRLEIRHAGSDLCTDVNQLWHPQAPTSHT